MIPDQDDEQLHPAEPIDGVFTPIWQAEVVPPNWVIKDLVPPGLVFMAGPPKCGKSTLTMAITALVSGHVCHTLPPSLSEVTNDGTVMVFSYEATAGELRYMMEHGLKVTGTANDESILIADDPWIFRLDDPGGLEKLLFWLNERQPRLVILDPLRDFHQLEEKDSGQMNRLLRPLRQWAVDHNSAVMVVHHTKKIEDESKGYAANDMRGTTALFGIADGVLILSPKGEGRTNIKATFKRAKGWERTLEMASYERAGTQGTEILQPMDDLVLRAVKAGAFTVEAINDAVATPRTNLVECIARLQRNGLLKREGRIWKAMV